MVTLHHPSLKHFAKQTVKVKSPLTYDRFGKPVTFSTERSYLARIETRPRQVLNARGEVVVASAIVSIAEPDVVVTTKDMMTMPDATTPDILTVETSQDRRGRLYTVVYLQWLPRL